MPVNTKYVQGRRPLRFEGLDDIVADLDQLEGRPLRTLGNWSSGQILAHLAIGMNGAIDGLSVPVPWYIRMVVRLFKRRMLSGTMPPGFVFPKEAEPLLAPPPTSESDGFAAVRRGIQRLKTETHRAPSPFMGPMTIEEVNQWTCRHCELHLSFIVPDG